ncbi:hypothetical protein LCGC14_2941300, partial [marine sediment metagenome]
MVSALVIGTAGLSLFAVRHQFSIVINARSLIRLSPKDSVPVHIFGLKLAHDDLPFSHWDRIAVKVVVVLVLGLTPPIPPDKTDHFRSLIG